jgi:hypothetical protein
MSYIVGFDLGTHQTKICIQDTTNPAEKIYEFLEFVKPDGSFTVLFPSVVQINTDETVSYGFIDGQRCLKLSGVVPEKPILELIDLPSTPPLPKEKKARYPKKPTIDPWKDQLLKIKGEKTCLDKWEEECIQIDATIRAEWNKQCTNIKIQYEEQCNAVHSENKKKQSNYEKDMDAWKKALEKEHLSFRYFKLCAFTDSGYWESHFFSDKEITIWYIAYILILLREKLCDDFSVQFGAPVGGTNSDKAITSRAYSLYIAAYNLSEVYESSNAYVKASYKDLRKNTNIPIVSENLINENYFDDLPEAFAGLIAVTTQKKLGAGFHMLADIGGGTTDMAMFYVDSKTLLPDVILITSFAKGLNFVFEHTRRECHQSLDNLQELFFQNSGNQIFRNAIEEYRRNLIENGEYLEKCLFEAFENSKNHHGKAIAALEQAINQQPIIYCGGGSVYTQFHTPIGHFSDIRKIDKEMLNIKHVRNESKIPNNLYPILSISYGLASYEKPFEGGVKCTDISIVFPKSLPQMVVEHNHNEYNLLDD